MIAKLVSKVSASALIAVNNGTAQAVNGLPTSNGLRCLGDKVTGSESDFSSSFPSPLPDVYKDASNNIYFKTSAGATVPVGLAAQSATRSVTSDRCGGLTVGSATRPQDTPFTINGVSIDPASLSVGLKPSCKLSGGSYAYDVEPTGNFKTSSGQVFVKTTTANPTGFGDRRILSITTSGSATRNLKANACGIASIRSTSSAPITGATEFSHNGNNYTVTDLPVHTASCVNAGTSASPNYQLFRALN